MFLTLNRFFAGFIAQIVADFSEPPWARYSLLACVFVGNVLGMLVIGAAADVCLNTLFFEQLARSNLFENIIFRAFVLLVFGGQEGDVPHAFHRDGWGCGLRRLPLRLWNVGRLWHHLRSPPRSRSIFKTIA